MSLTLEVAILSAENLQIKGKPVKKNTFVVIKTDSNYSQSTKADQEGGSNPSWNEHLILDIPTQCRFINVEVQCKVGSGNSTNYGKLVGVASVPVSDFVGDNAPENYLHFLSYRLRDGRGDKNGIINISVRIIKGCYMGLSNGGGDHMRLGLGLGSRLRFSSFGWPQKPPPKVVINSDDCNSEVVMGFPVWCASRT